jgi:hypothetical protein
MAGWFIVVFWSTIAFTTDDIFKHLLLRDSVSLTIGLLFAVGTRFFESVFVCISLPFLGAYFIGLGVDLIYQTGLVYTFGTSICFYEPLPKYTQQSIIAICIVAGLWFIGVGAYLVAVRGRRWGLNIKRIYTEEEQPVPSSK